MNNKIKNILNKMNPHAEQAQLGTILQDLSDVEISVKHFTISPNNWTAAPASASYMSIPTSSQATYYSFLPCQYPLTENLEPMNFGTKYTEDYADSVVLITPHLEEHNALIETMRAYDEIKPYIVTCYNVDTYNHPVLATPLAVPFLCTYSEAKPTVSLPITIVTIRRKKKA